MECDKDPTHAVDYYGCIDCFFDNTREDTLEAIIEGETKYTSEGKKIGSGAETRILSDLEATSFHIEWENNNKDVITYNSIEEFREAITNGI